MSFAVFTDGCSNLPGDQIRSHHISVLPCTYTIDGQARVFEGDMDTFNAREHYDLLRSGKLVQTSLLNTQLFLDHFRPVLEEGRDVVYLGMSSGISGTYQAATLAAEELMEEFPERTVRTVDSKGAGLGVGLLALRAADLRDGGKTANEAADILDEAVENLCQYFTVEDLMFLRRTGRLAAASAVAGTMLNIKPILWGDETGHIVAKVKCRGRKKAIETLAKIYEEKVVNAGEQRIAISHGDCLEEAQLLADKVCAIAQPKELIFCAHEPVTGSHVGPGMIGLFFFGNGR